MKVIEKKLEDGRIQLDATAATAEVSQAFEVAGSVWCMQQGLPPEQGKRPAQIAQERMGISDLDSIVAAQAIEYLVPFAIDKHNLVPAFPPKPSTQEIIKRGKTFSFTLRVTPKPAYELTSYDPVEITVPPFSIDEGQVDIQLQQIVDNYATYEKCADEPLAPGRAAKISLEAMLAGERMSNLSTDGRTYIMGQGLMPDEFEKQIEGMKPGDEKTFSFEVPGAPAGDESTIECTVKVLESQKKSEPEINDEWVAQNMPMYRDAAALKGSIRESVTKQTMDQYNEMKLTLAVDELSKRFQGKISDQTYEATRETLIDNLRASVQQQGMSFDQFVQAQGGEQQFGMMLMMQVRQTLVQGYCLDALFRHENMKLEDADLTAAARAMNPQYPDMARKEMEQSGRNFVLREAAERLKANKWLLEHAKVTEA